MKEVDRIVDQMERMHVGSPWTNMPYSVLLEDVSHLEASAKPVPDGHSIWEIVLHLMTAQQLIVDLVQDESRPYQPGDEWPPILDDSAVAWEELVDRFFIGEAEVREIIALELGDEHLDEPFREGGTPAYNNLHGYIQHAAYHGGQISLLKTLAEADPG